MGDGRASVIALLRERGCESREEGFRLSSGGWSHDYVDAKRALADGPSLELGCRAVVAVAEGLGARFDAVGGLTMGADHVTHGVALVTGCRWFTVRKAAKEHGRGRRIEGTVLGPGDDVLLVEDATTTGGALLEALDAVEATGARATAAVALVDRGDRAQPGLAARGVPFGAVATYRDLGIQAIN